MQRNATRLEISSGSPMRPKGMREMILALTSASSWICKKRRPRSETGKKKHSKLIPYMDGSFLMKEWNMAGLTICDIAVLVYPGAMQFVRILSFAHSQAKFLVSWFVAPEWKDFFWGVINPSPKKKKNIILMQYGSSRWYLWLLHKGMYHLQQWIQQWRRCL